MSDFDTQRKLRMEAMQDKKKRLEELKKMRQGTSENQPPLENSFSKLTVNEAPSSNSIDNLLNSILKPADSSQVANPIVEETKLGENNDLRDSVDPKALLKEKLQKIEISPRNVIISIPPVIKECYDKIIQTEEIITEELIIDEPLSVRRSESANRKSLSTPSKPLVSTSAVDISLQTETKQLKSTDVVVDSIQLASFLTKSSKYVERAILQSSQWDILVDYAADNTAITSAKDILSSAAHYPVWSFSSYPLEWRNRPVLSMDACNTFKELYIISYGARSLSAVSRGIGMDRSLDNGIVCVWSSITSKVPEIMGFSPSSPILISKFHPYQPKLLLCGCYSGQILLFDMSVDVIDAQAQRYILPVQKSLVACQSGHKYPIIDISFLEHSSSSTSSSSGGGVDGSGGAGNMNTGGWNRVVLITVSSDYHCCHWDILSMNEPIKSYSLKHPSSTTTATTTTGTDDRSTISALAFTHTAVNIANEQFIHVYLGNNEGKLYHETIPSQYAGTAVTTVPYVSNCMRLIGLCVCMYVCMYIQVEAHFGMITGMRLHTCSNQKRLSILQSLILTISIDWTIKLWDGEQFHPAVGSTNGKDSNNTIAVMKDKSNSISSSIRPLLEWMISTYDYVCDIQWSPTHPALFAAITANNKLYIYNLLVTTTAPVEVIHVFVSSEDVNGNTTSVPASTKLCWNSNGKIIYIGNSFGVVTSVPLSDTVTSYNNQDDIRLIQLIQHLKK